MMALKLFTRRRGAPERASWNGRGGPPTPEDYEPIDRAAPADDPLDRLVQAERYGVIVRRRPRRDDHPRIESLVQAAARAIDDRFALVPEGFASLAVTINDAPGCPEIDIETSPFLLARHCVSNAQYHRFVADGGYDDLTLWPRDIWPHLIDFQDQTGRAGPRFWREGAPDRRRADHPVVGICFYEAAAYATWAGYRLPTAAEWQMAASWRIRSSANVLRRYPWGDAFDVGRCNTWLSNLGGTVPVAEYASGAAPNGVLQLIGNVWEWTDFDFEVRDDAGRVVVGAMELKEIRGGAFDTYFPAQATSVFRSALAGLARVHNVGFRCALDLNPSAGPDEQGSQP